MFPEVEVYRYVTEQTFDAYLYQLVESKQKFISQIMTSKSPVRSAEDVDEVALSFAEVKMLATGDERFKEKMDLDMQVAKLKVLKQSYLSEHYDLEDRILKHFPQTIKEYEERIVSYESDAALAEQHVLGDAGEAVGVVQAAGNVAAFLVVFLQVRGKEEHGGGAEGFRIQEVGLHPDGRAADVNEEFDVVVFQERVVLAHVLRGHGTVFRPDLVVVAVAPQDADAYEVLPQVVRAAHVGAGQVAQAAGVDFE